MIGGLYVIIDPAACGGRDPVAIARAAIDGGASTLQWRDKVREKGMQFLEAREIYELCIRSEVPFIVNDHADLALALFETLPAGHGIQRLLRNRGVALLGVHVGQKDLPVALVRRILPAACIVGASTNNVAEARKAQADGAGYIAVGDLFGTGSKEGTHSASLERLKRIKRAVRKPVIGIGGITAANVAEVTRAGADGVAVISAVCAAPNPRAAAEELVRLMGEKAGAD